MATDLSRWPLLALMEQLQAWISSARRERFWQDITEHQAWAERVREEAKGIIVWLELKGHNDAASRLDYEMGRWREAVGDFRAACEGVYPPEDPRCADARETMIEAAGRVAGAAEDLHDEVPEGAWEGFFDA